MDGIKFLEKNQAYLSEYKKNERIKMGEKEKGTLRHCNKCGKDKPPTSFYKNSRGPGGLSYYCKECDKARIKVNDKERSQREKQAKKNLKENNHQKNKDAPTVSVKDMIGNPALRLKAMIIKDMALTNNDGEPLQIHIHILNEIERISS